MIHGFIILLAVFLKAINNVVHLNLKVISNYASCMWEGYQKPRIGGDSRGNKKRVRRKFNWERGIKSKYPPHSASNICQIKEYIICLYIVQKRDLHYVVENKVGTISKTILLHPENSINHTLKFAKARKQSTYIIIKM